MGAPDGRCTRGVAQWTATGRALQSSQARARRASASHGRAMMRVHGRSLSLLAFAALNALLGGWCIPASAQEAWPTRPIRMLVPLAAGGGVDMMARLTAQHLSDQLGQQVVVENQGGAGGTTPKN